MTKSWLIQSLIGLAFLTPAWLAIPFFQKNYDVPPATFVVWYFLGAVIFAAFWNVGLGNTLAPSWRIVGLIVLVGLIAGGIANLMVFSAIASAPNPGLPVAIANGASVTTFFIAVVLWRLFPAYFAEAHVNWQSLLGVLLVLVGSGLIATRA